MNCDVCCEPILRRYFKQKFLEKDVILCPMCNKKWAEIKERWIEIEDEKKDEAEKSAKEAENDTERNGD